MMHVSHVAKLQATCQPVGSCLLSLAELKIRRLFLSILKGSRIWLVDLFGSLKQTFSWEE